MKYIILLALTTLNAILYRMGGSDTYDKLWRRIGCAVVTTGALLLFLPPHWTYILHILLLYGALTTYLSEFIKPNDDVCGTEWFLTGILYGLTALPLIAVCSWYSILIRTVVLGYLTYVWSVNIDDAVTEELGRGALIIATLPILML